MFRITKGCQENNQIVGNTYDKYNSSNPIIKFLMYNFSKSIFNQIKKHNIKNIHEIGCGEGYWTLNLHRAGFDITGSDHSEQAIKIAKLNAQGTATPPDLFSKADIYKLPPSTRELDLLMCLEVLEHLEDVKSALQSIKRQNAKYFLFSVPREPIWSILNMLRAKYVTDLGNTPGHVQRWSRRDFIKLINEHFNIIEIECPLPWTIVLCKHYHSNFS